MIDRQRSRAHRSMMVQERRGLFIAASVRTALSIAVAIWQLTDIPFEGAAYLYGVLVPMVFVVLGIAHMAAALYSARPAIVAAILLAIDVACMSYFFTTSNPYLDVEVPLYMALRWDNLHWFFVLLAQAAMALNWYLVAWCGLLIALARVGQLLVILNYSDAFTEQSIAISDPAALMAAYQNVAYVSVGERVGELLAVAGVTAGLIAVVMRSSRLVLRHAVAERGRASLARYFSPNTVDALLANNDRWRQPKRQRVAVMFLDIMGFTRMCANQPPEFAVQLLKDYHQRIVSNVFAHQGTLDKYIGDGVMITFGTPYPLDNPATQAFDCAVAIQADIEAWNTIRRTEGLRQIRVGTGIHIGEAVVGDIGDSRRMEFAVIGDVVNRASRLEKLTRHIPADIIVSEAMFSALGHELGDNAPKLEAFGPQVIPGFFEQIPVFGRRISFQDGGRIDDASKSEGQP